MSGVNFSDKDFWATVKYPSADGSDGDPITTNGSKVLSFTNGIKLPYGSFSDSTTQTFATSGTAYAITFDTDEYKSDITHSTSTNPSRITITKAGAYLISYSACVESPMANKHINIWLKVDGTTVARTNTILELPLSGEFVITVTYIYVFTANQYFELFALSDVNNMTIKATAAGATVPASPSIICTVNKISK